MGADLIPLLLRGLIRTIHYRTIIHIRIGRHIFPRAPMNAVIFLHHTPATTFFVDSAHYLLNWNPSENRRELMLFEITYLPSKSA
jgi:hypothetical protein